jgi:putative intracellular protease/amidase
MDTNRRALLQGFTGAALLAPYLALERAMAAETAKAAPAATAMSNEDHMAAMSKVLGPGLWGQEQVAMLLYPKFTALDLVGPHYFFACMWGAKVHLVTTEKDLSPVMSDLGLAISPTMTMADAPKDLDVLFIPGGTEGTLSVMGRTDTIGWVKDRASRAKHITSVCTGSMVLAKAGLLKGKRATSHWVTRETLADFGATPVNERVVKDGNILTGAGVSSGLDFGLALVEMLRGKPYAQSLMLQAEYHPQPPFPGGTLATTPGDVGQMMDDMFKPVAAMFKAMATG